MGEWSGYFEDFPEEDPANQTRKPEDPLETVRNAVKHSNREQANKERAEINRMIEDARERWKSSKSW